MYSRKFDCRLSRSSYSEASFSFALGTRKRRTRKGKNRRQEENDAKNEAEGFTKRYYER